MSHSVKHRMKHPEKHYQTVKMIYRGLTGFRGATMNRFTCAELLPGGVHPPYPLPKAEGGCWIWAQQGLVEEVAEVWECAAPGAGSTFHCSLSQMRSVIAPQFASIEASFVWIRNLDISEDPVRHLDRSYGFKTQMGMTSETVEGRLIDLIWCAFHSQPWRQTEREHTSVRLQIQMAWFQSWCHHHLHHAWQLMRSSHFHFTYFAGISLLACKNTQNAMFSADFESIIKSIGINILIAILIFSCFFFLGTYSQPSTTFSSAGD